jgi:hypothetical protein
MTTFLMLFLRPPGKYRDSISNEATTAYLNILLNSLLTNYPTVGRGIVWNIDSVIKYKLEQNKIEGWKNSPISKILQEFQAKAKGLML